MDRSTRLRSLWRWLPDFRAVAETEHLPTASDSLHVSASSLSRSIGLLEDDVGQALFDRVGRAIVLNDSGRELLSAVRRAMRGVDEALSQLGPGRFVGSVRISAPGPFAALYALPAIASLSKLHPGLVPTISSVPDDRVGGALSQGRIDVAVMEVPPVRSELQAVALTPLPYAICCGPGHPLHGRRRVSAADIDAHPFVSPPADERGRTDDGWPPDRKRHVGLVVHQMRLGVEACASGAFLAVLPVPVAKRAGLRCLPSRGIAERTLYAVWRTTVGQDGRAEAVVEALSAAALSEPASD